MRKLLVQLLIIVAVFFAVLWLFNRPNWMKIFHVEEVTQTTEEKLGKLYWDFFKTLETEETKDSIIAPVDSLLSHICDRNEIDREKIKLHFIRKDEVNAFALPDNHLVIYTGLISDCENEGELAGVIAHELAHMEKGHIMRKLTKEIGLSVLISMTGGQGSPEIIRQAIKILTSTAYDRNLESEADKIGVDYLIKAGIDPESFATFLYRLSAQEKNLPKQVFWVSTHPGSEERSKAILDYASGKTFTEAAVLDSMAWQRLQKHLNMN